MLVIDENLITGKSGIGKKEESKQRFKDYLFNLLSQFAEYQSELNSSLVLGLICFQYLQVLGLILKMNKSADDSNIFSVIKFYYNIVLLYPFMPLSQMVFLVTTISCLIMIIMGILLWIPYIFSDYWKEFTRILFFMSFYCLLLCSGVLYLPLLGSCIVSMDCDNYKELTKCFESDHLTNFLIGFIDIVLLCFISLVYNTMVYTLWLNKDDPTAISNRKPSFFFHILRTALMFIITFRDPIETFEILVIVGLLVVNMVMQAEEVEYCNLFAGTCIKRLAGLSLWFGIIETLMWYFDDYFDGLIIGGITLCGIGFTILTPSLWKSTLDYLDSKGITIKERIFECIALVHLRNKCIKEKSRYNYQVISGYYINHYKTCKFPYCPISQIMLADKNDPYKYYEEMIETLLFVINRRLKKVVLDHPESIFAKSLYISVIINLVKDNYILAWELNRHLKRLDLNLFEQYTRYYQKKFLRRIADKAANDNNLLEPLVILRKLKIERKFRIALEENTVRYSWFWDILQDTEPKYEKLMKIGSKIFSSNKDINTLWKYLRQSKAGVSLNLAQCYWSYCNKVKVDPELLKEIEEEFSSGHMVASTNLLKENTNEGNGIMSVSGSMKSLGKIRSINGALCQVVGYPSYQLIDKEAETIIPSLFKKFHAKMFETECYILEGGSRRVYTSRRVFLVHKSKHIIPAEMKITESPSILNRYCFIAGFKTDKSFTKYNVVHVLTDVEGNIKYCTSSTCYYYIRC